MPGPTMKALVLIGGFGTRLRPVTYALPKQLIPIAGKPMLYHNLDLLPTGIEEVVLATGYKADLIDAYVRSHPPRWPVRMVAESEPLGTGGGMRNAGDDLSDPFFLLNSDVIADVDLSALATHHARRGGLGTMTLTEVEDTRPYGVAELTAEDRISRFVEKPAPEHAPSHWINAGVSIWRREVLEAIPRGRAISFEQEIVPHLLDRGLFGFRFTGYWDDAGTPERLLRSQRLLFDGGRGGTGTVPSGALGSGPVAVLDGATVRGASFGRYVTVGTNATVEAGAYVENSVVMDGARIGHDASVIGSIVGPDARVLPGHRVAGQVLGERGEA